MLRGGEHRAVVVVGGGASSACVALGLARRGPGLSCSSAKAELGWDCSAGKAGVLCPTHAMPLASPAALRQGLRWLLRSDSPLALRPRPGVPGARLAAAGTAQRDDAAIRRLRAERAAAVART